MLWGAAGVLHAQHKTFGVIGDSLTFVGGLLLAAEVLFRKTEHTAIAAKDTIVKYFPDAQDADGKPISPSDEEKRWAARWDLCSRIGVVALATGFACLLLVRIFAE